MRWLHDPEVSDRVDRLDLPFNIYGLDPYGISKKHLVAFHTMLKWFYRHYFHVRSFGIDHVPDTGRAMLIGNHSGGVPVDAGMVLSSLLLDKDPPRHAHGMVEKFAQKWPLVSQWFSRMGQLPGLPEHALRLLEDDRLLMVFPEGVRGTGKLYRDRYVLQRFGTGFVRLALRTGAPIVPFAFIGGEEAVKTIFHARTLARLTGAPYWPVPPQIIPFPLPTPCAIHYGEPMVFEGTGNESDEVICGYVRQVKVRLAQLIAEGLRERGEEPPADPGIDT
jgi:1-acyl-sn-glycerol-3-phosphate acyltransferase